MSSTEQDAEKQAKLALEQQNFQEVKDKLHAAETKVATLSSEWVAAMAEDTLDEAAKQQKQAELEAAKAVLQGRVEDHKSITIRLNKAKANLKKRAPLLKEADLAYQATHYSKLEDEDGKLLIYTASHPDAANTDRDDQLRTLASDVRKQLAIIPEVKDSAEGVPQSLLDMTVALTCAANGVAVKKKV